MSGELWIAGAVFMILGVITAAAGIILNVYGESSRPYGGFTEGKVVEIVSLERDPNMEAEFRNRQAAVFEFYANGKLMKVLDQTDTYPCPYELNQRVRISYDPDYPIRYEVVSTENRRILSIALNAAGVVLILIGVFLFLRYAGRFMF